MSHQKSMFELSLSVYKLSRSMTDFVQQQMIIKGIDDLHPTSGTLLLSLLEKDGQTLSELARLNHMKAPTITLVANRLEKKGWIRRERCLEDRRNVHVMLTGMGRKHAKIFAAIRRKTASLMASGLNGESIDQTNETLNRIISNVNNNVV